MPSTSIIGLQWGDEAKGKLVDLLTEKHEIVVRYQGGANAGHTVVHDGEKYKLSLIPSGILTANVSCVVTGGVVINPPALLGEVDGLTKRGIKCSENLMISDRAHIIFPWHFAEDAAMNKNTADGEDIGTTQRGIGPCYRDKVGRSYAIRFGDMYRSTFRQQLQHVIEAKKKILIGMGVQAESDELDAEKIYNEYSEYAKRLKIHLTDTTSFLLDALEQGRKVLFEGAQGALLDVDHGTYPFVTSSNSSGVGVCGGAGVPPRYIGNVLGVVKAYCTRVGGGPFPTEQDNETGNHIRELGNEYGTVTKRPRRCGWFDAVAARYTTRLSGVNTIAVMLLDVLSELEEIKICTAYKLDGKVCQNFPSHVDDLRQVEPVYETLAGWQSEITDIRNIDDLPENARIYLNRISELLSLPVDIVSVGPDRKQTMFAANGLFA